MNAITTNAENPMTKRSIVDQSIDRTKSSKSLSWYELLAKGNGTNANYPLPQCDSTNPQKEEEQD